MRLLYHVPLYPSKIAHISPSLSCSEHTLNTLRYTSRVKELPFKGISEKCDTEPSENVPTAPGTNMENVSDGDVDHDAADAAELKARQETEEKEIITEILNDIKSDFGQLISSQEDIMQYLITRLEDRKNTSIERKKRLTKVYKQYCAELIGSKQAILSRLEGIN
ncbi:MAG: Kinesin-like protein kif2a [Marteilia pararefringens]